MAGVATSCIARPGARASLRGGEFDATMTTGAHTAPHPSPPPAASGRPDAAAFLERVGARLRTLRAERGMTRRALARQAGVSERYIAQTEAGTGNMSILLLRAIAQALALPVAALLDEEPEQPTARRALDERIRLLSPGEMAAALALLDRAFGTQPAPAARDVIALIGLRGGGKSTLGTALAARLGVPFHELDREIEREAGLRLAEIFELHGQPGYRRAERAALERLLAERRRMVVATGGGIVADRGTFDLLLRGCRTIWVRAAPEEHMQRVVDQGDTRPMQDDTRQAMADLRAILAARAPLYARADQVLDTSGRTVTECLEALVAMVG
jgi:XRE family aerobic/anaerobic benzoate catabolism transcriptional regulator